MSLVISETEWKKVKSAVSEAEDYRAALKSLMEVKDKRAELSVSEVQKRFENARTVLEKYANNS